MVNAGTFFLGADVVSFQLAFVNVNFTEKTSVSDAAQALVFVLYFIDDAVSLVLAQTNWADWLNPSNWDTVSNFSIKDGSDRKSVV